MRVLLHLKVNLSSLKIVDHGGHDLGSRMQSVRVEDNSHSDSYWSNIQEHHGNPNSNQLQLALLFESQKQLMMMFQDASQRISTLENAVANIKSNAGSPSSSSSPEQKKRIPSQLTVRL